MAFSPLNALAVTPTDTARENKIYLYFFIGWYSEGQTYSAGEAVEITNDRSFAAVWNENQYFIEYYSNFTPRYEQDDAGVRDEKTKIVSCGFFDEVTILDNPFEHPDETARFIGWSLERTGKPVYKPGDVVQGLSDEWYGVVRAVRRVELPGRDHHAAAGGGDERRPHAGHGEILRLRPGGEPDGLLVGAGRAAGADGSLCL